MLCKIKVAFFTIMFLLCSAIAAFSQENNNLEAPSDTLQEMAGSGTAPSDQQPLSSNIEYAEPVPLRAIDAQKWTDAAQNLDYSKDVAEEKKNEEKAPLPPSSQPSDQNSGTNINWSGLGQIVQVIIIFLALLGIGYAIFRMLQQPQNKRIASDGTEITADNVDQYLHETALDRFLKDALAQQNYALAIRLYYLQIIKGLSEKKAIHWSKEKTNRDYQREMRNHHLADAFRWATRSFEQAWYGNEGLSVAQYRAMEAQFKALLSQI